MPILLQNILMLAEVQEGNTIIVFRISTGRMIRT